MANGLLLEVRLPGRLLVQVCGPHAHPHLATASSGSELAHFAVRVSDGSLPEVRWETRDGHLEEWDGRRRAPCLYEDTRYWVFAEDLTGTSVPTIQQRDPTVLTEVHQVPSKSFLSASLNFGRQVGIAEIGVTCAATTLTIEAEVFPTKLDYRSDYQEMITDIEGAARALALEYFGATYSRGTVEPSGAPTKLEWLVLLRRELARLDAAVRFISEHPSQALHAGAALARVDRIKRTDGSTRRSITRGMGRGSFVNVPKIGAMRMQQPFQEVRETLDTPEHRWLAHNLGLVARELGRIRSAIVSDREAAERAGRSAARLRAQEDELGSMLQHIASLVSTAPLRAVAGLPPPKVPSLALLKRIGYGQAYQSLMTMRLGLAMEGTDTQFSTKSLDVLYETWCFLALTEVISDLLGVRSIGGDIFEESRGGICIRLAGGRRSELRFATPGRSVTLVKNPRYRGLTGDQIPDAVLELQEDGWPAVVIVFDSKYRLQSDSEYVSRFGAPGPPIDAVNALHRYRDAILITAGPFGRGRPTVKGAALFPTDDIGASAFAESELYRALSELGIGALPFTPGNKDLVASWIAEVLDLPVRTLAEPGPPFLAWNYAHSLESGVNK